MFQPTGKKGKKPAAQPVTTPPAAENTQLIEGSEGETAGGIFLGGLPDAETSGNADQDAQPIETVPIPVNLRVTEILEIVLTDEERIDAALEMVETVKGITALEDEAKSTAKRFRDRIAALEVRRDTLGRKVHDGTESRSVECEWMLNIPEPGKKLLIRLDTLEQVEQREMSQRDYDAYREATQLKLDLAADETTDTGEDFDYHFNPNDLPNGDDDRYYSADDVADFGKDPADVNATA